MRPESIEEIGEANVKHGELQAKKPEVRENVPIIPTPFLCVLFMIMIVMIILWSLLEFLELHATIGNGPESSLSNS